MLKACIRGALFLFTLLMASFPAAFADSLSVVCDSPTATAPTSGGTTLINVDCAINAPDSRGSYRILDSDSNFMAPSTISLVRGLRVLTGTLQPNVTSPDNNITSIAGTSSGFTAALANTALPQIVRFQYRVTTDSSDPAGTYVSLLNPAYYRYRICTTPSCSQQIFTGTAAANVRLQIASTPTSVSCASEPVTAPAGGGTFQVGVTCTVNGTNAEQFTPSSQNMFSPSTITFFGNNNNINAMLQPVVTSPDNSITGISGTAGGGFTGTINTLPATVRVHYQGTTSATTRAGTYTSTPVSYVWSTL